jgi:4-hydroxy-tetrahydrodipicolinate reductase
MKILLSGYLGRMGAEVRNAAEKMGYEVFGVDSFANETEKCVSDFSLAPTDADCIIDFSHHSLTGPLTLFAVEKNIPLIIATTGQTEEELNLIKRASEKIPLFFASNYSLGVALLIKLAEKTAAVFPDADIEIVEKHHNRKIDAPSGTAVSIASALTKVRENAVVKTGRSGLAAREKNEIGVHAVRLGNIVGEHEVIVGTDSQTITLKHEAHSRALFAEGALTAAEFLMGKEAGLYDMNSMISF